MQAPEFKMPVSPVCVVELISIREFGNQRARVFGERVEEYSIDGERKGLSLCVSFRVLSMEVKELGISIRKQLLHQARLPAGTEREVPLEVAGVDMKPNGLQIRREDGQKAKQSPKCDYQ
jgi:hypothetical protein